MFNERKRVWALKMVVVSGAVLSVLACGEDEPTTGSGPRVPDSYAFAVGLIDNESSVDYAGQVFRHLLIADMKRYLDGLTDRIDSGTFSPGSGDVVQALEFYFDYEAGAGADVAHGLTTVPAPLQKTYGAVHSGTTLREKIAGNDAVGQHKDWARDFVGWDNGAVTTPESLVRLWFQVIDDLARDRLVGKVPLDPGGALIGSVFVTPEGHDVAQLLQKFLLGAVAFSQGADDYLDDDTEGKGLLSDHTGPDGSKPYTALEHAWDEGFGYFGAARDYADYTDSELSGKDGRPEYKEGYHDSNGDGWIDLHSEFNFGHSTNAAKRDRGSADTAPTDYTKSAIEAFLTGRAIIQASDGALGEADSMALRAQRDIALRAWEEAIASTVVHYFNEVLQDMGKFGTADYRFLDHAKHWSELKGFALSFQFNRRSPMTDAQFDELHTKLGQAPVLPGAAQADIDAYKTALLEGRAILQAAYGFAAANIGDENGENGW